LPAQRKDVRNATAAWSARVAAASAIALSTSVLFVRNRGIGLIGTDTWPLVLASRARSLDELAASLSAPMGGGHLPPIYYRPLLHLSLAFDQAVGALDPGVYQLTSALIFGAACAALYAAAEELLGGRSREARVGALIGLAFFLLHPVHAVCLPDPARRPELLSVLFASLAVAAQARAARVGRRVPLLPGLWTAAAALSKETSFVLPALCFATAWAAAPDGRRGRRVAAAGLAVLPSGRRVAAAGLAVLPSAAALLGVLALRVGVLGAALGERPLDWQQLSALYAPTLARIARQLVSPGAFVGEASAPAPVLLLLAASLAVAALRADAGLRRAAFRQAAPALLVSLGWLALCALVYALSGIQPWYLSIPAAGLALGMGALAALLLRLAEAGRAPRLAALAGLACLVGLTLDLARFSPLLRDYPEWQRASQRAERYLERLGAQIRRAAPGSVLTAPDPPVFVSGPDPYLRGVYALSAESIGPWAALHFEARNVRVVKGQRAAPTRRPDEILLVLGPLRELPPPR
jgi:hypothetical protein